MSDIGERVAGTNEHLAEARKKVAEQLSANIKKRAELAQKCFKKLDGLEDIYRSAGRIYHMTGMRARNSSGIHPDMLRTLETASHDYNVWFEPIAEVQELLKRILLECRPNGTLEALRERDRITTELYKEMMGRVCEPTTTERDIMSHWHAIEEDLESLVHENGRLLMIGMPNWFEDTHEALGFKMPSTPGVEWTLLQQWVYTLPETRKSLPGLPLDKHTSDVLYKTAAVYDSHWSRP